MNTAETSALTPSWARIGKSTVFDLVLNAQTEDNDFIEDEIPTTDIKYYKPSLAQELQANKGDAAFDYLYDMFFNLPTGEDVKKDLLIVFDGNIGSEETPKFKAWKTKATLIPLQRRFILTSQLTTLIEVLLRLVMEYRHIPRIARLRRIYGLYSNY